MGTIIVMLPLDFYSLLGKIYLPTELIQFLYLSQVLLRLPEVNIMKRRNIGSTFRWAGAT